MGTGIAKSLGLAKQVEAFKERKLLRSQKREIRSRNKTKVFCIGRNKTGTTSLKQALENEGYILGNQRVFENLGAEFRNNDYDEILYQCTLAEAFQDFPFSYPSMYKTVDKKFANSKFILTVRNSPDQWYRSLTNFHSKLFGKEGNLPTVNDLQNAKYISKGWIWENFKYLYNISETDDPYDYNRLTQHYINYNNEVKTYFKDRPSDLLILNLTEERAYEKFCKFLDISSEYSSFPWENKTERINEKHDNTR